MVTRLSTLFRRADPERYTCSRCRQPLKAHVVQRPSPEHPKGIVEPVRCKHCPKPRRPA